MTKDYVQLQEQAEELRASFRGLLYPHCFLQIRSEQRFEALILDVLRRLMDQEAAQAATQVLVENMPKLRELIDGDVDAAYQGDPAALSREEVILSYPAFSAISTYRLAHELYLLQVPLLPRLLTEQAHRETGIDIHPGADIGPHFFIDHGTGVVIGETTVIGENVKLYQGVTLGAKSFAVNPDGTLIKGVKRHPNIGNNVVIYSGATILGGETFIGDGCIIGGNVWLTSSVPAGCKVYSHPHIEKRGGQDAL